MDALRSLDDTVGAVAALYAAGTRAELDVSLMKTALELQKVLGAEIAALLGVGASIDIRA